MASKARNNSGKKAKQGGGLSDLAQWRFDKIVRCQKQYAKQLADECDAMRMPAGAASVARQILPGSVILATTWCGSGFCISSRGHILTCGHCVSNVGDLIDIVFADGSGAYRSKCIRMDTTKDCALLQVQGLLPKSSLPFLKLASAPASSKTRLVCVGQPCDEDLESSEGGKPTHYPLVYTSFGSCRGYIKGADPLDNSEIGVMKHNCWTYWGHSGAPLVDLNSGEVVGMHSSWDPETAMRHAVSVECLRAFLTECKLNVQLEGLSGEQKAVEAKNDDGKGQLKSAKQQAKVLGQHAALNSAETSADASDDSGNRAAGGGKSRRKRKKRMTHVEMLDL